MMDEAVTAPLDADESAPSSRSSRLKTMFSRSKRRSKGESATLPPPEEVEYPEAVAFNIPSGQQVRNRPPKLVDHEWEEEQEEKRQEAAAMAALAKGESTGRMPPPQVQVSVSEDSGKAAVKLYPGVTPEVCPLASALRPGFRFPRHCCNVIHNGVDGTSAMLCCTCSDTHAWVQPNRELRAMAPLSCHLARLSQPRPGAEVGSRRPPQLVAAQYRM